ncbi:hypothetical protein RJ639_004649 [Escallonia herrerae]|uniref:TRAF-type domain-containing protein n=1 Tax=Escallonia herrerae TaxID=1293975 RepID=A0AA88W4U8_9ASTE|nr:hypothetical protein RJ639_004649 [Escallonia herrerae]
MDPPLVEVELNESLKAGAPVYYCDLFNTEVAHKIAQVLLLGLASACVDNTTGDLFKSPASVAVDVRREMVDYLTQKSETFVAETFFLEADPDLELSEHPYDIISYFIDDFQSLKRNFFSRISGWLLSDRREDQIDDFVQEMEMSGFWLIGRREAVTKTLLKNIDFKNMYYCGMLFNTAEELADHMQRCSYRILNCNNEGCNARFTVAQMDYHDSVCPFKIIPCEQKCSDSIMRREMDRHCITICPMKLLNCSFYKVGCRSTIPQCTVEQHQLQNLPSHLLYILQVIHKEVPTEELKRWAEQLEKLSSPGQLAKARDVRSLSFAVKDLEAKLGPLEVNTKTNVSKHSELPPVVPKKIDSSTELPAKKEEKIASCIKIKEITSPPIKKEELVESATRAENCTESPAKTNTTWKAEEGPAELSIRKRESTGIPQEKEESPVSITNMVDCMESPAGDDKHLESLTEKKGCIESHAEQEEYAELPINREECAESPSI